MLAGDAKNFTVEVGKGKEKTTRPLYIKPVSTNFPAIDSVLITASTIHLIQCTLGDSPSFIVKILFSILHRLGIELGLNLSQHQLVYHPLEAPKAAVGAGQKPMELTGLSKLRSPIWTGWKRRVRFLTRSTTH
ncbi:hypothetical protein C8R45DRAFT_1092243 [Mycena sanguinolenta]|nr:hypothetical protein C8R45DRAFT_1092243 [Mycena sanguinolenta]